MNYDLKGNEFLYNSTYGAGQFPVAAAACPPPADCAPGPGWPAGSRAPAQTRASPPRASAAHI